MIHQPKDLERPFYITDFRKSDYLFIAFGSYAAKEFEWFNTFSRYENKYCFSKMWISDLSNSYWHGKFQGIDNGVIGLSDFIKLKIKESGALYVICFGLSMGGYGATLLGSLCNVTMVLSFSGQTFINEVRRTKYNLYEKWKDLNVDENLVDLKILFKNINMNNRTIYKITYGINHLADSEQAKHLKNERGVELYPINTDKHNTAYWVIKSGMFDKFINEFFNI